MALSDQEVLPPPADPKSPVKRFVSREDWLNAAGKLREEEHDVEGLGTLLLSEVSGEVRADLLSDASQVLLLPEGQTKRIDRKAYERKLLLAGVIDPESPAGDRNPLFKPGDMDKVMKIGGGKIASAVDVIERLSGLGQYQGVAEKNSNGASGAGTSA